MQAHVDAGRGARGGDHGALVDVEGFGPDRDAGVAGAEFARVLPVRGGFEAVQQARRRGQEHAEAMGGHRRAPPVRPAQRLEDALRGLRGDIRAGQDQHEVGRGQQVQVVLDQHGRAEFRG